MKNKLDIGKTTSTTIQLHKVDVHSKKSTTPTNNVSSKILKQQQQQNITTSSNSKQLNSGSTNTTPITSPSMDTLYLKPPPSEGEMAAQKSILNAKVEIENPIFQYHHQNDGSDDNISPPSSSPCSSPSPKGKRVKYAKHLRCQDPKAHGRSKSPEPSSEKARVRRQASTLSTGSDKVMILGDVATNEIMIINNHSNNKSHFSNNYKNSSDIATFTTNTTTTTTNFTPASLKSKINGSTSNAAIAITTLSPTSCLSRDKTNSTTVVTHLQKKTKKTQNKKFRFSPFSKKTLSPPLIEPTTTTTFITTTTSPQRCPPICTPFCSCSSSFNNENQLNYRLDLSSNDDCSKYTSSSYIKSTNNFSNYTSTTNKLTTCDNNFLRPPPTDLHENHQHTFNTTATSTAHNWNNFHHQQVHVCMCFL